MSIYTDSLFGLVWDKMMAALAVSTLDRPSLFFITTTRAENNLFLYEKEPNKRMAGQIRHCLALIYGLRFGLGILFR